MFIIVLGQHVSSPIESSSGPSKKIDPYLEMFKMSSGVPNAYILYKVSKNVQTSLFMKIRPVRAELFHVDGQTDGRTDGRTDREDEVNSRFSQFS